MSAIHVISIIVIIFIVTIYLKKYFHRYPNIDLILWYNKNQNFISGEFKYPQDMDQFDIDLKYIVLKPTEYDNRRDFLFDNTNTSEWVSITKKANKVNKKTSFTFDIKNETINSKKQISKGINYYILFIYHINKNGKNGKSYSGRIKKKINIA